MTSVPVLVVAVAIVDDLDRPSRLLAARRARPAHLVGRWEFPGGKVDPGETPQEAVHREVREELGVRVALGAEICAPSAGGWPITERHVLRLWCAVLVEGEPSPLAEHDELRWLEREDWHTLDWLDGDVAIVHALARHADGVDGLDRGSRPVIAGTTGPGSRRTPARPAATSPRG